MTDAVLGYDVGISVESAAGSGVFIEIAEVTNVTPPSDTVDDIDATHMKSPGRVREFISGLSDPGDMSLDGNYIPGSDTDAFIVAWRLSGETRAVRIVYPADLDVTHDQFPAYVKSYVPTMAIGEKMGFTLGLKVAGAVVRT
jgi:predicted secreted protein